MELQGSKTELNLLEAYGAEAQAKQNYIFYAEAARRDGYEQIACLFEETAKNEGEHARLWYKYLNNGDFSATDVNLGAAAEGERYEHEEMYPLFAEEARREGFHEIAEKFEQAAKIERYHEGRFHKLLGNLEAAVVFSRQEETPWVCRNCGYVHQGESAPESCPVCGHPQAHFEIQAANY